MDDLGFKVRDYDSLTIQAQELGYDDTWEALSDAREFTRLTEKAKSEGFHDIAEIMTRFFEELESRGYDDWIAGIKTPVMSCPTYLDGFNDAKADYPQGKKNAAETPD